MEFFSKSEWSDDLVPVAFIKGEEIVAGFVGDAEAAQRCVFDPGFYLIKPFGEVFVESLQKVNNLQQEADEAIEGLATGERADIAQTMIAVQKASLSFEIMKQVRNQLVQAYEEVLRMPV